MTEAGMSEAEKIEHRKTCFSCALMHFTEAWLNSYPKGSSAEDRELDTSNSELAINHLRQVIWYMAQDVYKALGKDTKRNPVIESPSSMIDCMIIGAVTNLCIEIIKLMRNNERFGQLRDALEGIRELATKPPGKSH